MVEFRILVLIIVTLIIVIIITTTTTTITIIIVTVVTKFSRFGIGLGVRFCVFLGKDPRFVLELVGFRVYFHAFVVVLILSC